MPLGKSEVLELGQIIKEHMSLDNKEVVARANGIEIEIINPHYQ